MELMQVLSNDQIRRVAPSVFAPAAHESCSARYQYIPTVNVMDAMRSEGFMPVYAGQSRSRVPGKSDFTKHMIRFRRDAVASAVGLALGAAPEAVLINSHDGTSCYKLLGGAFRFTCANGLILGDIFDSAKVQHSGNIVDKVIEGSYRVIDTAIKALEMAAAWKALTLSTDEQMAFGRAALQLRFDPETQPVNVARAMAPRRAEDRASDLWTTFNRAQESVIRGGQSYYTSTHRRQTARAVVAIDKNVGLNQALWTLGAEMAKLKA